MVVAYLGRERQAGEQRQYLYSIAVCMEAGSIRVYITLLQGGLDIRSGATCFPYINAEAEDTNLDIYRENAKRQVLSVGTGERY